MWRVHRKLKCSRVLFRPRIVLTINGQRDEGVMAVWTDDVDAIIPLVSEFEERLMKLVWKNRPRPSAPSSTHQALAATSSGVRSGEQTGTGWPNPTARDKPPNGAR